MSLTPEEKQLVRDTVERYHNEFREKFPNATFDWQRNEEAVADLRAQGWNIQDGDPASSGVLNDSMSPEARAFYQKQRADIRAELEAAGIPMSDGDFYLGLGIYSRKPNYARGTVGEYQHTGGRKDDSLSGSLQEVASNPLGAVAIGAVTGGVLGAAGVTGTANTAGSTAVTSASQGKNPREILEDVAKGVVVDVGVDFVEDNLDKIFSDNGTLYDADGNVLQENVHYEHSHGGPPGSYWEPEAPFRVPELPEWAGTATDFVVDTVAGAPEPPTGQSGTGTDPVGQSELPVGNTTPPYFPQTDEPSPGRASVSGGGGGGMLDTNQAPITENEFPEFFNPAPIGMLDWQGWIRPEVFK